MPRSEQFVQSVQSNLNKFIESLEKEEGTQAALFFAPKHHLRNGDAEYPYRQSSDILYLTGWEDAGMALLIRPHAKKKVVMFVPPKDPKMEIWTGFRAGVEGAKEDFGADDAFAFSELTTQLPNLLMGVDVLHYRFAENSEMDQLLLSSIAKGRKIGKGNGMSIPERFCDPSLILHRQRLIKSDIELKIIRKAAEITSKAHQEAMKMTASGVFEYQLEAKIAYVFRDQGGNGPGYTTIVGGGANAVILHYIQNDSALQDGDLVCVDAGCEFEYYTADVTRTWPVNGSFSPAQRELYEAVLKAEELTIQSVKPGVKFSELQNTAARSLTESLVKLGILEGDVEELLADKKYRKFYMHGVSHWLGMDVHDVGPYVSQKDSIPLAAGMLLTIEPGLYFAKDDESIPEQYRGIGIRIEDDILVTEDGSENLTAMIPRSIEDIEAIVGRNACC